MVYWRTDVLTMSSLKLFLILYYIKQIDSKLSCVCSVIDHRGCQNVVRTSVTHSAAPRVPLFCSYRILMSSVIYYWTDVRQLGIYLLTRSYPYFSGSLLFFRGFLSSLYILQAQFSNSFGQCCLRYSLDLISAWKYEKLNLRLCTTIKRAPVSVFLSLSC